METDRFYHEVPNELLSSGTVTDSLPVWISSIRLYRSNPFVHSTVIFPKLIWEKAGGYDTQLDMCVDYDFFLRAMQFGKVAWLPSRTVLYYRNTESFFKKKNPKEYISTLIAIKRRARPLLHLPLWFSWYQPVRETGFYAAQRYPVLLSLANSVRRFAHPKVEL
jgi:hypothetical protein